MMIDRKEFFARVTALLAAPLLAKAAALRPPAEPLQPEPGALPPDALERWRNATRTPVRATADPVGARLLAAGERGVAVRIIYWGGTQPGATRTISPGWLFRADGFPGLYVAGYCHRRRAERVFALDRIALAASAPGASCAPTPRGFA